MRLYEAQFAQSRAQPAKYWQSKLLAGIAPATPAAAASLPQPGPHLQMLLANQQLPALPATVWVVGLLPLHRNAAKNARRSRHMTYAEHYSTFYHYLKQLEPEHLAHRGPSNMGNVRGVPATCRWLSVRLGKGQSAQQDHSCCESIPISLLGRRDADQRL